MPRLARTALLLSAVLLGAAPAAGAKEVTGMKICGREGCVALKNGVGQRFHNSGALYAGSLPRDPGPVRAYRLVMLFGDGNGGVAGRVSMAYSPQLRAVLPLDAEPSAVWSRVTDSAAARLSRLAGELSPLPARHLRAADGTALPPEVWEPWREAAAAEPEADDGLPRPLLAGVPAAALLLLGVGFVWLRRRPGS